MGRGGTLRGSGAPPGACGAPPGAWGHLLGHWGNPELWGHHLLSLDFEVFQILLEAGTRG